MYFNNVAYPVLVSIGYGKGQNRRYPLKHDLNLWASTLKDHFPDEHKDIDEFVRLVKEYSSGYDIAAGLVKILPLPLAKFVIKLGLVDFINTKWAHSGNETTKDVIDRFFIT